MGMTGVFDFRSIRRNRTVVRLNQKLFFVHLCLLRSMLDARTHFWSQTKRRAFGESKQ